RKAMLGLLAGEVDLEEARDLDAAPRRLGVDRMGDLRAIDRMDGTEEIERRPHLVRLQRTDQVPFGLSRKVRHLLRGLLDPVLAEQVETRLPRFEERLRWMGLGHPDEGQVGAAPARACASR